MSKNAPLASSNTKNARPDSCRTSPGVASRPYRRLLLIKSALDDRARSVLEDPEPQIEHRMASGVCNKIRDDEDCGAAIADNPASALLRVSTKTDQELHCPFKDI
jgi:hypothetical protein